MMSAEAILVGIFLYAVMVSSTPLPATCNEPSLADLDALWTSENSGNVLSLLADQASVLKQSTLNGETVYGDTNCPADSSMLRSSIDSSLYQRSTCPYFYVTRMNETYYPRERTEVSCRCNRCLEESGPSGTQVCEPVTLPIKMLRRTTTCVDGLWKYESFSIHIPVSCTCAVARVYEKSVTVTPPPEEDQPIGM